MPTMARIPRIPTSSTRTRTRGLRRLHFALIQLAGMSSAVRQKNDSENDTIEQSEVGRYSAPVWRSPTSIRVIFVTRGQCG